jgi:HlyD family secretion protein
MKLAVSSNWSAIRRWLVRVVKLLLVAAVIEGVVFWVWFSPLRVTEHRIEMGTVVAEAMGTGTLEARVQSTISPKIYGRIKEVPVDQGERVEKGRLLVRLDDEELQQQVEIANASLAATQAAVDRLQTDRKRAVAVLEQSRKEHARLHEVVVRNAASRSEFDRAVEALAIAEAGLAHADAAITEAEKEKITAEKTLEYHRARLTDATIQAPFDGLIVRRQRDPGDVVVPGSPILTLISTEELWISAWVDETAIDEVFPDQSARVIFRSEPDQNYSGIVARLGRETDRETREFIVDVRVLDLPKNWAVGQRAEVYIEAGRKESVPLLPAAAVVWRGDRSGVFVNVSGYAEWRPVRLGLRNREMAEVIEGVQEGETVVTPIDAKANLADGRKVRAL